MLWGSGNHQWSPYTSISWERVGRMHLKGLFDLVAGLMLQQTIWFGLKHSATLPSIYTWYMILDELQNTISISVCPQSKMFSIKVSWEKMVTQFCFMWISSWPSINWTFTMSWISGWNISFQSTVQWMDSLGHPHCSLMT